jgi:hypothetical protein
VVTVKPAWRRPKMVSGGGTSIRSTWPLRSTASRVLASGMGSSTTRSSLAFPAASQQPSQRASSTDWRGVKRVTRNGPVPAGAFACSAHTPPARAKLAGEVIST